MVNEFQKAAVSTTLEIPMIYVIDAVHGHSTVHNMTVFPHNIGLGAARDPDLVRRIGAALLPQPLKSEQQGSITLLFPASQDPRWGRCYESYSEDHRIVHEMTDIIYGLQGEDPRGSHNGFPYVGGRNKVAACAKHFVGDGGTTRGIDRSNTVTDAAGLFRIHMPAYIDAVSKGASTIMVSYSSWSGIKMQANHDLITGFLKNTLQFKGFVISDWLGLDRITTPDHANYTYSVLVAIQAGVDMDS